MNIRRDLIIIYYFVSIINMPLCLQNFKVGSFRILVILDNTYFLVKAKS